jgi:ribosome-binding factor A
MVSITEVEVTPDYAHAHVYFSTLAGEDKIAEVQLGLQKASGFLRRELGRRVRIHTTPQLHFIHDTSLERGADLSKLIDEASRLSDQSENKSDE